MYTMGLGKSKEKMVPLKMGGGDAPHCPKALEPKQVESGVL